MKRRPILAGIGTFVAATYITANVAVASPAMPSTPEETADSNTFTLILNDDPQSGDISDRSEFSTGACIGTFSLPKVDALGIINYGLHVKCSGSGFLPLKAKIDLQEEHGGAIYQKVDSIEKNLTEGGYGFVLGEVVWEHGSAGHDYRIAGKTTAGSHVGTAVSDEVHLPCNV